MLKKRYKKPQEELAKMLATGQLTEEVAGKMLSAVNGTNGATAHWQTPLVLDLRHAAQFVGFSESHFRRMADEGAFKSVSFGKSRWFRVSDLKSAVAKA